jgi:hypothetical protein
LTRETCPSLRTTLASLAEYSCKAAMAFSALLSWETPTTPFRMRIVRINRDGFGQCSGRRRRGGGFCARSTHNYGIDECAPTFFVIKESESEGNSGGTEEDDDKLIFELFEDKLPEGSRGLFRDS